MNHQDFGFQRPPFADTPDSDNFFHAAKRGVLLDAIVDGLLHDARFIKVSGEPGAGKTVLYRRLQQHLPEEMEGICIDDPKSDPEQIITAVRAALRISKPDDADRDTLIREIRKHMARADAQAPQPVVLVDDAHELSVPILQAIPQLIGSDIPQGKGVKLVLFGDSGLDEKLALPDVHHVTGHIDRSLELSPMRAEDVDYYLRFRLLGAGYRGPEVFSPNAVNLITSVAGGLPGPINALAGRAFKVAVAKGRLRIKASQVKQALRAEEDRPSLNAFPKVALAVAIGVVLGAFLWFYGSWHGPEQPEPTVAQLGSDKARISPKPATRTGPGDQTSPPKARGQIKLARITPPHQPGTTPEFQAQEQTKLPETTTNPGDKAPPTLAGITGSPQPEAAPESQAQEQVLAIRSEMGSKTTSDWEAALPQDGRLLQRLAASETWLAELPTGQHSIQLMTGYPSDHKYVEKFLKKVESQGLLEQVHIIVAEGADEPTLEIFYGDYSTLDAARNALAQLPGDLRQFQPYLRTLKRGR